MSFFDAEDFLCEDQRLKAKFLLTVPKCSRFLGETTTVELTNDSGTQIDEGHVTELPFWLCAPLYANQKVELSMPRFYSARIREEIQMSAKSVPFGQHSLYYFRFAMKMMSIMRDDSLYAILFKALMARYPDIVHMAQNAEQQDLSDFLAALDSSERSIFKTALLNK